MQPEQWAVPPPGYKPGQTRAPLYYDIAMPLAIIAVILATLRFYVRACLLKSFGRDDWLLVAAVIFLCWLAGANLWGVILGIGKHEYDLMLGLDPKRAKEVCYSAYLLIFQYLRCFLRLVLVAWWF